MTSSNNSFVKNVCKILGHDLRVGSSNDPTNFAYNIKVSCARCGVKREKEIRYGKLYDSKTNVLSEAERKLLEEFKESEEREAEGEDL